MTYDEMEKLFEDRKDEFLKFQNMPAERRRSNRPDLNAFLLLDALFPAGRDMVSAAEHDEIFLDVDARDFAGKATEDDVLDLIRCGVMLDGDYFHMFA